MGIWISAFFAAMLAIFLCGSYYALATKLAKGRPILSDMITLIFFTGIFLILVLKVGNTYPFETKAGTLIADALWLRSLCLGEKEGEEGVADF